MSVTEDWLNRKFVQAANDWTGERYFSVDNAGTQVEAIALVGININDNYPDQSRCKCREMTATRSEGFNMWRVTVVYSIPPDGALHRGIGSVANPLDEPIRISWPVESQSEQVDTDVFGNPILTANLTAFDTNPAQFTQITRCRITQNLPFFDVSTTLRYTNTYNVSDFTFAGVGRVMAGQGYCNSIRPTSDYTQDAGFVPVEYNLTFMPYDPEGASYFNLRLLNQDYNGYYMAGSTRTKGIFCDANGNRFSKPVLIDDWGVPLDATVMILGKSGGVFAPVQSPSIPVGATFVQAANVGPAYFVKYTNYRTSDFTTLLTAR